MTTFDERGKAFENKYALDEEQKFKALARRNKQLGLWAAEKLGKSGEHADSYAKDVILADFEEKGDEDVIRKIAHDFESAGLKIDASEIRSTLNSLTAKAAEQVKNGG